MVVGEIPEVKMNKPCIFLERMKYDICRTCNGYTEGCQHYSPQIDVIRRNEEQIDKNNEVLPMIMRLQSSYRSKILPRNYRDWVKRRNEGRDGIC